MPITGVRLEPPLFWSWASLTRGTAPGRRGAPGMGLWDASAFSNGLGAMWHYSRDGECVYDFMPECVGINGGSKPEKFLGQFRQIIQKWIHNSQLLSWRAFGEVLCSRVQETQHFKMTSET